MAPLPACLQLGQGLFVDAIGLCIDEALEVEGVGHGWRLGLNGCGGEGRRGVNPRRRSCRLVAAGRPAFAVSSRCSGDASRRRRCARRLMLD